MEDDGGKRTEPGATPHTDRDPCEHRLRIRLVELYRIGAQRPDALQSIPDLARRGVAGQRCDYDIETMRSSGLQPLPGA